MMVAEAPDIWKLTFGRPQVDPNDLAKAIVRQVAEADLDYRTRLLIRDGAEALRSFWGPVRWSDWLKNCSAREPLETICGEAFDEIGFPSLRRRLMEKTDPETIRQFLTRLGQHLRKPIKLYIAGSVALILPGYLSRQTEDIDVVDEIPKEIREDYAFLEVLQNDFGLHLGHVQTHYFPSGWMDRSHSFAAYNHLQVALLDVHDVYLSKLFSVRMKDMGDLRILTPQLEKEAIVRRLRESCGVFLTLPRLKQIAEDNWQVLFGESLPQ